MTRSARTSEGGHSEGSRPRVLHVIWSIPHYRAPVFRRLSQHPGMDFQVCAGDDPSMPRGASITTAAKAGAAEGINWRRLPSRRSRGPILRDYEWQSDICGIVWNTPVDAVITMGNKSLSNWLVRIICKLRRIPLIEWTLGVVRPEAGPKWWARKFYMRWADAHLLYGEFARSFYVAHGFRSEDVFVVHNSLDHDKQVAVRESITREQIRATRAEFGVDHPDARLVVHIGRLERRKKLHMLMDAARAFREEDRLVKVVLVGGGREEQNLRRIAAELDVDDRVIFFGRSFSEEQNGRIFMSADLTVGPGQVGLLSMHSLAYGTPLLTCLNRDWIHGPETDAIVEGQTGGFFRPGDLDDLVNKMRDMLFPEPCKRWMSPRCMAMIDREYTPAYQERVIIQALNHVLPTSKQIPAAGRRTRSPC